MTQYIRISDYQETNPSPKHEYLTVEVLLQWIADRFQWAAYAGMEDLDTGITSLGAAWTDIRTYANNTITPRGITTDLVNGSMIFDFPGVYRLTASIGIEGHNSSNSGRKTRFRLYNDTDGVGDAGFAVGIGRNVEDTFVTGTGQFEIFQADVGKEFILQLGNGDSITGIDLLTVIFEAETIGEFRGSVLDLPQPILE